MYETFMSHFWGKIWFYSEEGLQQLPFGDVSLED